MKTIKKRENSTRFIVALIILGVVGGENILRQMIPKIFPLVTFVSKK